MSWLTPDVVRAVAGHMNADHVDDLLVMVAGQAPGAVDARVTGVDLGALHVEATMPDGHVRPVALAWPGELTSRADIRKYVVQIHIQALEGSR